MRILVDTNVVLRLMDRIRPILWLVVIVSCTIAAFGFVQVRNSYIVMDRRDYHAGIKILLIGGAVATAAAIPLAKRKRK